MEAPDLGRDVAVHLQHAQAVIRRHQSGNIQKVLPGPARNGWRGEFYATAAADGSFIKEIHHEGDIQGNGVGVVHLDDLPLTVVGHVEIRRNEICDGHAIRSDEDVQHDGVGACPKSAWPLKSTSSSYHGEELRLGSLHARLPTASRRTSDSAA